MTNTGNDDAVAHGLSKVPELVIVKERAPGTGSWYVETTVIDGSLDYLLLESTAAKGNLGYAANLTATTFPSMQIGVDDTQVAYCFHSVDGYSKIDSYIGNGDADGPYVHLGFRPAWIMIKGSSVAENWNIIDATRSPINAGNKERLQANATTTEGATWSCDFLSNGFKIRTTDGEVNTDAATYIFLAFAETPFKYANAR